MNFSLVNGAWSTDSDVDMTLANSGLTWTLTDHDDTVETYTTNSAIWVINNAQQALLGTITARNGYTQTLAYNGAGQLATVTDSYGRQLVFTYTGLLINSVATPDGLVIGFGYGSNGLDPIASQSGSPVQYQDNLLLSVIYSTNPATSQTYGYVQNIGESFLTSVTDENGHISSSWTYDGVGRGLSSQHGNIAELTTVSYNDADGSRTVTNALGQGEVYRFATLQGVQKLTEIDRQATATTVSSSRYFAYDANGYLASSTDWNGNLTTYANDARGESTNITEASGTSIARTTIFTYLANYHLPSQIIAPGVTTDFGYDSNGNLLTKTQTDTSGANAGKRSWAYNWSNSLLKSVTGPRGDATAFAYSSSGALAKITNALGQATRITAQTGGGYPKTILDTNGIDTVLTYSPRLWPRSSSILAPGKKQVTSFIYDAAGNLVRDELPDGSFLAYSSDTANRLTAVTDRLNETVTYTVDALGDTTATLIGKAGGAAAWADAGTFDSLGRKVLDQKGAGEKSVTAYDNNGNARTTTDALSRSTRRAFDALNRVVQIVDPAQGTTNLTYNAQDRVTSVTAANGAATSYVYDGFGRLIQRTSPDTGITAYAYDAEDHLLTSQDAAGIVTSHSYDALGRITSTTYPAGGSENVVFTYDQKGHGFSIGRLTSVSDSAGTLSYTYDALGNTLSESRASGEVMLTTSYTYDAANRIASIAYPSGTVAAYIHNLAGQVTGINVVPPGVTAATALISTIEYKPFGPVSSFRYSNGLAETRSYDTSYRLTKLVTSNGVQSLNYSYNAADDVLAITDSNNKSNSQKFGYDVLDHLTAASGAYGEIAWTYDLAGNQLTQTIKGGTSTQYGYVQDSDLLVSLTAGGQSTQVTTSPSGNMLALTSPSGNASNFTFDQAERLAAVTVGGNPVAGYAYDAFGRRFSKTLAASQSLFQYGLSRELLEEANGTGGLVTDTVYLSGAPIADVTPNALYYLHTDRLGTPQVATTTQQSVAWRAVYQPFGLNSGATGLLTQNIRLPGQYSDNETHFYQNGFRDYNPAWGRYLESDPIGLAGGVNTFGYVAGNPLAASDRLGLEPSEQNCIVSSDGSHKVCTDYVNDPSGALSNFCHVVGDWFGARSTPQTVGNWLNANLPTDTDVYGIIGDHVAEWVLQALGLDPTINVPVGSEQVPIDLTEPWRAVGPLWQSNNRSLRPALQIPPADE